MSLSDDDETQLTSCAIKVTFGLHPPSARPSGVIASILNLPALGLTNALGLDSISVVTF